MQKLFHIPEEETPAEKQLRRVLISSLCGIFLCMSCLVGSTWAWFRTSIENEGNVLTIGEVTVAVSLVKGEETSRMQITPSDDYTYTLEEVGTYRITVINTGTIAGHCTVKLKENNGASESFTTGTLYPAGSGEGMDSATITITIDAEDLFNELLPVTLEIIPHWGEDPNYAVAEIDENIFAPEEETTSTEETLSTEETEATTETEATEETGSTEATEETSPDETTAATEPDEPTETTEATEATESTEETGGTEATEETGPDGTTEAPEATEAEPVTEPEAAETEPEAESLSETEGAPEAAETAPTEE